MNDTKSILEQLQNGALTVDEAMLRLKLAPFEDLGYAKVDHHRALRQGAAEVIYGEGKTVEHIAGILTAMRSSGDKPVLVTRLSAEKAAALRNELGAYEYTADEVDKKIGKAEKKTDGKSESERRSLAGRMAGKYSYHAGGENGENEYYTMDVVNFGDNLYAFCGRAFPDGDDSFGTYSFWATEFVPYDAKEISSADGDSVKVNELNFSVMSNAGKYWDSGHTGTITLTDDGLVFAGFDHDGFLVPDNDDSRLFLKDDRAEDAFKYLKHRKRGGDEDIQGFWVARDGDSDLYIEFSVTNMYIYSKDPDSEVFYAAGGCDFREGGFDFAGNFIENGGMPFEFTADYKVEGDSLKLAIKGDDVPDRMPKEATFERISEEDIHVTTMDEIVFDEDSFGAFGQMENEPFYGV